ncbi:MAG: hypothetical protein IKJ04_05755 [Clostridia bacterium]|nr:hypothetical protein [Clostridia bacterium]
MKNLTAKGCISLLEENESKIKDAITELYTSYALDSVRHELWMYVDDEGEVSLKTNVGYAATHISNEERFFIYSCGGENVTAWDVLPSIEYLLNGEELRSYVDAVKKAPNATVTERDVQKYIEAEQPLLIDEWLDEFFSDSSGHISNYVEEVYDNLLYELEAIA